MSSEVKERPIVAELSALEGAITGLEEAISVFEGKASMYLKDVAEKDEVTELGEFRPSGFILDTLLLFMNRVNRLKDKVDTMIARLV